MIDDYENKIIPSQNYFTLNYLEKVLTKNQSQSYKEMTKLAFTYQILLQEIFKTCGKTHA